MGSVFAFSIATRVRVDMWRSRVDVLAEAGCGHATNEQEGAKDKEGCVGE